MKLPPVVLIIKWCNVFSYQYKIVVEEKERKKMKKEEEEEKNIDHLFFSYCPSPCVSNYYSKYIDYV